MTNTDSAAGTPAAVDGKLARFLIALGTVFLIGALALFVTQAARPLLDWRSMRDWRERPARVIESTLDARSTSEGRRHYKVVAAYRYAAGGRERTGTRVGLLGDSDGRGGWNERMAAELDAARVAGREITVLVDPDDPERSIVDAELRAGRFGLAVLFSVLFGAAGGALLRMGRHALRDLARGARGDGR